MGKPWIAVDLDGTLSEYHGWVDCDSIGAPIPAMVARVKRWLSEGREVRIFTARYADTNDRDRVRFVTTLSEWTFKHIGQVLPVTGTKDCDMIELWDDRAVQVETNTGRMLGYSPRGLEVLEPSTFADFSLCHCAITGDIHLIKLGEGCELCEGGEQVTPANVTKALNYLAERVYPDKPDMK